MNIFALPIDGDYATDSDIGLMTAKPAADLLELACFWPCSNDVSTVSFVGIIL